MIRGDLILTNCATWGHGVRQGRGAGTTGSGVVLVGEKSLRGTSLVILRSHTMVVILRGNSLVRRRQLLLLLLLLLVLLLKLLLLILLLLLNIGIACGE